LNSEAIYFRATSELFKPIRKLASAETANFENRAEQAGLACATPRETPSNLEPIGL
jgi:hypothetical protein